MLPYATDPSRNIRRPRRPGDPIEAQPITPIAAPIIPAPRARNLSMPESIPIPEAVAPSVQPRPNPIPGPDYIPGSEVTGIDPTIEQAKLGKAEVPGTRHGFWGRLKDFGEAMLYSGGNPIAAGLAAAMPGKLAQWKYNMIEQPRLDERNRVEGQQEALRQQALLRAAQARKADEDSAEDRAMRPFRQRQMVANTTLAEANAQHALRPPVIPQHNAQTFESDAGLMERGSDGVWRLAKTDTGNPARKPIAVKPEPSLTPYQKYQIDRDLDKDAKDQLADARKVKADFERVKDEVSQLDAEWRAMKATSQQAPNSKGMVSYKGKDYNPVELAGMADQKDAEWKAAQARFEAEKQNVAQHPGLELDASGVGAKFRQNVPRANAPSSGKVPVISSANLAKLAQRKGFTGPNALAEARAWFESQGGVIQ